MITSEDCDGEAGCGVEAAELSSSESRLVARLWRDRDCDSLEFISASRVTCTHGRGQGLWAVRWQGDPDVFIFGMSHLIGGKMKRSALAY